MTFLGCTGTYTFMGSFFHEIILKTTFYSCFGIGTLTHAVLLILKEIKPLPQAPKSIIIPGPKSCL